MDSDVERTLNNLHVLAAISQNDKLMTNEDGFDIYQPSSLRGLMRLWCGERRGQNVTRIRQTVRAAMRFAYQFLDDVHAMRGCGDATALRMRRDATTVHYLRVCEALEFARNGLQNLLQTYRDDAAIASQMRFIMTELDDFAQIMRPHTEQLRRESVLAAPPSMDPPPPADARARSATAGACQTPLPSPQAPPPRPTTADMWASAPPIDCEAAPARAAW